MLNVQISQQLAPPDDPFVDDLLDYALSDEVITALPNIELRGNNLAIQTNTDPEIVLTGAAGTGKTLAILLKIHYLAWKYPGVRILIARKVRKDLVQSVLVTFERDILGENNPICAGVRREYRQSYRYPNGSEIVLAGMDRPGSVLSAEYDFIFLSETVQFSLNDWEMFSQRLSRHPKAPYSQLMGDTNPDRPDHWILQRTEAKLLTKLDSYHKDNPALWDDHAKAWTAVGEAYVLGRLARLTGIRKLRYLENKWVIAEGAIYDEWRSTSDERGISNVIDVMPEGWETWRKIRSIDFGFTKPFVCQWWAIDPDGRMYLYREIYRTEVLVEDHALEIKRLSAGETIEYTVADHDAEGCATLKKRGISTRKADKSVSVGIQNVQSRVRPAGDGKPRLFILRSAREEQDPRLLEDKKPTSTLEEIPGYIWANNAKKESPLKVDDHGCDALRYAVQAVEKREAADWFEPEIV